MNTIEKFLNFRLIALLFAVFAIVSCSDDDNDVPEEENELEVITDVTLVFTNTADASDVVTASAQDPDGAGIQELELVNGGVITLSPDTEYTLTYEIFNNLETPGEDIGEEIAEEDDEHQFFFSFSDGAFASPTGNGNIDNASDPINYNDQDGNGNPLGLSTNWTTPSNTLAGQTFTVRLQHQPDVKTATSGATDGDTDFDLEFVLNIQ